MPCGWDALDGKFRSLERFVMSSWFRMIVCIFALTTGFTAYGQDAAKINSTKVSSDQWNSTVQKAVSYLRSQGQADDGSYSKQSSIGVTALVVTGLLNVGVSPDDPVVSKSLDYLLSFRQPDGGIYLKDSKHTNYETSLVLMALAKANRQGKHDATIAAATKYVKQMQWDETEEKNKEDMNYGGAGYGSKSRPDLSNTGFMIDALKSVGTSENDEAIQKALFFVSRCQNLDTPANTTPFAKLVNDGGFYYTPAAGGESFAGKEANGGLRSYGSMTYAGLKSMIFAGVKKDDPRVVGAIKFLKSHYSVTSNPGMGTSGLFYYYHTMAKALDALGNDEFVADDGAHAWRSEIFAQLQKFQSANGSFVNPDTRWLEGDANLVTGYALLTLAYLKP